MHRAKYIMDIEKFTKFRQDLHKIPELGFQEFETKTFLMKYLNDLDIFNKGAKLTEVGKTGFFIDFPGQGGKSSEIDITIAYRTDLDGLPIDEETGVPYSSTHPHVQHACGHDGHMTILVAFLEFYSENIKKIPSNVNIRFIFQPAEEGLGGANSMIEGKCLENVQEIYGLHNLTLFKLGEIGLVEETIMSRIDLFEIKIIGKGGHGSTPHLCHSPITIGANIVNSINQITSQEIDSKNRCVVTIGQFQAGSSGNVIPESALIKGSVRTIIPGTADEIVNKIKKISEGHSKIYDSKVETNFIVPGELTWNHPKPTQLVEKVVNKYFKLCTNDLPIMASEDFSFYQKHIPGCFFMLGCQDEGHKEYLHTSLFDFNDKSIPIGVEMCIRIVEEKFNLKLI